MIRHVRKLSAVAAIGIVTAVAAPANAATASLSLGPVPVPSVPVTVCVNGSCAAVPAVTSVSLSLTATTSGPALPVIIPVLCPPGTVGVGAKITAIGGSATITGDVSGTTGSGPFHIPIGPLTTGPGLPGATVSACTSQPLHLRVVHREG
jgi:hypothetical protein